MENIRSVMNFEFDTRKIQNTYFHQDPEIMAWTGAVIILVISYFAVIRKVERSRYGKREDQT